MDTQIEPKPSINATMNRCEHQPDRFVCLEWTAKNLSYSMDYCIRLVVTTFSDQVDVVTNNNNSNASPCRLSYQQQISKAVANFDSGPPLLGTVGRQVSEKWTILFEPRTSYRLDVKLISHYNNNNFCQIAETEVFLPFKPPDYEYFPRTYWEALMGKAMELCSRGQMEPVNSFGRAKSQEYWADVKRMGFIEAHLRRDNEGHKSPLNYSFPGIFFFARPIPHLEKSPFGDIMKEFPPSLLFGNNPAEEFRFYFADMKCYYWVVNESPKKPKMDPTSRRPHYITIAVCRKGSDAERYCSKELLPLNPLDNPFLKLSNAQPANGASWTMEMPVEVGQRNTIWIEIMFMERLRNINWSRVKSYPVQPMTRGGNGDSKMSTLCELCCLSREEDLPTSSNGIHTVEQEGEEEDPTNVDMMEDEEMI